MDIPFYPFVRTESEVCDFALLFQGGEILTGNPASTEKPIGTTDPFIFLTDDTEESIKRTGFRQIEVLRDDSNTGLRGTNRRAYHSQSFAVHNIS